MAVLDPSETVFPSEADLEMGFQSPFLRFSLLLAVQIDSPTLTCHMYYRQMRILCKELDAKWQVLTDIAHRDKSFITRRTKEVEGWMKS